MRKSALTLVALAAALLPADAQEPGHPVDGLVLDAHIGWIDCGARFLDGPRGKRRLSAEEARVDRNEFLDAAIRTAREQGRLVLWYVPRFAEGSSRGRQMYRAPVLDLYMRQVIFCDADVSSIITSSFVPVRMVCDEALSKRFDFRPLEALEPAIVVLDGEGRRVLTIDHIRTFHAHWFAWQLARVVESSGAGTSRGTSVDMLIRRGAWEEALGQIDVEGGDQPQERARAMLLSASLLRRLRRSEEAARRLEEAESVLAELEGPVSGDALELPARLDLERGRLALEEGAWDRAHRLLEDAWKGGEPEAGYLTGWLSWRAGDDQAAANRFAEVADRFPNDLAGRRARANVTIGLDDRPLGATFSGFESFGNLPDAAFVGPRADTDWSGEPPELEKLAVAGVAFLHAMQRDDGGFTDARYAYWPTSAITPNTWTAITALSLTALLEHRDLIRQEGNREAVDDALARGERYLLDPSHVNRGKNEEVYADAFRLLYLTRLAQAVPGRRDELVAEMEKLVGVAERYQRENGFFAHEYANAFCTAAMLWCLLEAEEVGVDVPPAMLEKGVKALQLARPENGAFSYGGTARGDKGSLKDAAGRMPICEAVLLRCGRGSNAALHFAIDNYWEYLHRLERVRLNDFHSDGELAGFFFFHDVFLTTETLQLLPDPLRRDSEQRFRELLQRLPQIDGTFVEDHEFGRSYATAMALLSLRNVAE